MIHYSTNESWLNTIPLTTIHQYQPWFKGKARQLPAFDRPPLDPGAHHRARLPRTDLRAAQRGGDRSGHGRSGVAGGATSWEKWWVCGFQREFHWSLMKFSVIEGWLSGMYWWFNADMMWESGISERFTSEGWFDHPWSSTLVLKSALFIWGW